MNKFLAENIKNMPSSGIRKFFDVANMMENAISSETKISISTFLITITLLFLYNAYKKNCIFSIIQK